MNTAELAHNRSAEHYRGLRNYYLMLALAGVAMFGACLVFGIKAIGVTIIAVSLGWSILAVQGYCANTQAMHERLLLDGQGYRVFSPWSSGLKVSRVKIGRSRLLVCRYRQRGTISSWLFKQVIPIRRRDFLDDLKTLADRDRELAGNILLVVTRKEVRAKFTDFLKPAREAAVALELPAWKY